MSQQKGGGVMTQKDPDPFDKAAAREAELEEVKERREVREKQFDWTYFGHSLSFFIMLVLLMPIHWILPHDTEWLIITHMVLLAIAGGDAVSKWALSKRKANEQNQ
jgi:hypothetical protein